MLSTTTSDFPRQLYEFEVFIGRKALKDRLQRTMPKLEGIAGASPVVVRRFGFILALRSIYLDREASRRHNFSDPEILRAVSTISSINEIRLTLTDRGRYEFRSRLLDCLAPDRDFRQIEHEIRAATHFIQKGFSVRFADMDGFGNYDILATNKESQIEIECKTLSEDVGLQIHVGESIRYFDSAIRILKENQISFQSGQFRIDLGRDPSVEDFERIFRSYLCSSGTDNTELFDNISFIEQNEWAELARNGRFEEIYFRIAALHDAFEGHSLAFISNNSLHVISIVTPESRRLGKRMQEIVRDAAKQLSGNRPGIVWMHLLGLTDGEMRLLVQQAQSGGGGTLPAIAALTFRSERRSHVKKLLFSADAAAVTKMPFGKGEAQALALDGPAYVTTNLRSKFVQEIDVFGE